MADLAVLTADFFACPEEEIKQLESVLTMVDGRVVYEAGNFGKLAPPPLPVSPDWQWWRSMAVMLNSRHRLPSLLQAVVLTIIYIQAVTAIQKILLVGTVVVPVLYFEFEWA